jgi:hypothetical protein
MFVMHKYAYLLGPGSTAARKLCDAFGMTKIMYLSNVKYTKQGFIFYFSSDSSVPFMHDQPIAVAWLGKTMVTVLSFCVSMELSSFHSINNRKPIFLSSKVHPTVWPHLSPKSHSEVAKLCCVLCLFYNLLWKNSYNSRKMLVSQKEK